jgi:dihydroorotate dehydrogenase (fumarate)
MADLTTTYLGLPLRSPIVPSASPLTGQVDWMLRLEDAGAGAVVLPSLFEEQIEHESVELDRYLSTGADQWGEATGLVPELEDYNTGPAHYLGLIAEAKEALQIPVIASLNGTTPGGWTRYARQMEEAGADALELNVYSVEADTRTSGAEIEAATVSLIESVVQSVDIPVAVKIGPHYTALANVAWRMVEAGAEGLVCFNRFYQPDIDVEALEVTPRLVLSDSDELRLTLRWIAILRGCLTGSLAATTGIHTSADVAKVLLAGADVAMTASVLLREGIEYIGALEAGLQEWLEEHGFSSVEQMKGSMSQAAVKDPSSFERANYMRTISSYSSTTHHI